MKEWANYSYIWQSSLVLSHYSGGMKQQLDPPERGKRGGAGVEVEAWSERARQAKRNDKRPAWMTLRRHRSVGESNDCQPMPRFGQTTLDYLN